MDFPVPRNREVEWIQLPIDGHDAKLAKHSVAVSRVEVLDEPHIVAGEFRHRGGKLLWRFDANKMTPGVKPRSAH